MLMRSVPMLLLAFAHAAPFVIQEGSDSGLLQALEKIPSDRKSLSIDFVSDDSHISDSGLTQALEKILSNLTSLSMDFGSGSTISDTGLTQAPEKILYNIKSLSIDFGSGSTISDNGLTRAVNILPSTRPQLTLHNVPESIDTKNVSFCSVRSIGSGSDFVCVPGEYYVGVDGAHCDDGKFITDIQGCSVAAADASLRTWLISERSRPLGCFYDREKRHGAFNTGTHLAAEEFINKGGNATLLSQHDENRFSVLLSPRGTRSICRSRESCRYVCVCPGGERATDCDRDGQIACGSTQGGNVLLSTIIVFGSCSVAAVIALATENLFRAQKTRGDGPSAGALLLAAKTVGNTNTVAVGTGCSVLAHVILPSQLFWFFDGPDIGTKATFFAIVFGLMPGLWTWVVGRNGAFEFDATELLAPTVSAKDSLQNLIAKAVSALWPLLLLALTFYRAGGSLPLWPVPDRVGCIVHDADDTGFMYTVNAAGVS